MVPRRLPGLGGNRGSDRAGFNVPLDDEVFRESLTRSPFRRSVRAARPPSKDSVGRRPHALVCDHQES